VNCQIRRGWYAVTLKGSSRRARKPSSGRLLILLLLVLVAAVVTVSLLRRDQRSLTRLGFIASGTGLLGLGLAVVASHLLVAYLAGMTTVYGLAVLVGCLTVSRCGRSGSLRGPR
jgi:hypothetical protein